MNKNLETKNNFQNIDFDKKILSLLSKNFKKIKEKTLKEVSERDKTYGVLSKKFKFNFKKKDLIKFNQFKSVAIIGMGGSILGSEAIYYFLKKKIKKKFYFFNDLNIEKISDFKRDKNTNRILFLIISKSGNTIETLSNLLALNILKKNKKNIILLSEKSDNYLFNLSKKLNIYYIEHKNYIGGRYSVLSEVGILPAYLMGLNIEKIRDNLTKYLYKKNELKFLEQSVTKLAYILKKKKFKNLIFLNYIPKLEKFLFWLQQLIAESLGKKGKGFLPVISNAPKDHHSLLQLYLDGPKDKLFLIFHHNEKLNLNIYSDKNKKVDYLHNKSLNKIKISQKKAVIKSFKNKKIPFREFEIKKISEKTLGELFSYFILEISITGKLAGINPFNQPAVEEVKIYTKKLLK